MLKHRIIFLQRDWEDNLGAMLLSAILCEAGFDSRILVEEPATYRELQELKPAVVAYSCMTGQQGWVFASIGKARAAGINALYIAGGPHATFYPGMLHQGPMDAIIRGEGEGALVDIMKAVFDGTDPTGIENTTWKLPEGGEKVNPLRPLVEDLDSLPFADRSHFGRYRFLAENPFRQFITGRGCPFQCSFCFNHALHALYGKTARYIRRNSPEYVLEDLRRVQSRWGIREVRFSDDHFALNAKWLEEFMPRYRKEIGRPFVVNARVDALDEEKIALLAEGGCRLLCFGIETGREDLRNQVLHKNIKDEDIYRVASLLRKYKILSLSSNIIGLPSESISDAWDTVRINQNAKVDLPWYSLMQYYPGTRIHAQAVEAGLISEDFDPGSITSYFRNDYLRQPNMHELTNIHNFAIAASWFPRLTPLFQQLAQFPPNPLFRLFFKASYALLSFRRSNMGVKRVLTGFSYYWRRLFA